MNDDPRERRHGRWLLVIYLALVYGGLFGGCCYVGWRIAQY